MVAISGKEFPEKHDLVIGVITKIQRHGVYVGLKEYDSVVGYCHISEVAGAWIRNIRNFVRIDQNVVAKVLRVDKSRGQVDVSLKRVSDQQKKEKNQEFKRQNSAIAMINLIATKANRTAKSIREEIEFELTDVFGSMYIAFEELAAIGPEVFDEFEFSKELVTIIHDVAETSIQISTIILNSTLRIRSFASDGVYQIREFLKVAQEASKKFPDVQSNVTSVGAPSYRIHLEGLTFPEVDEVYLNIEKALLEASKTIKVEYALERAAK